MRCRSSATCAQPDAVPDGTTLSNLIIQARPVPAKSLTTVLMAPAAEKAQS
ncbi:hypothetical protein [Acinetobacter indicus]|uniref:hypothetical protein n=1 Tax=Acinetobacter indicus TaxID=756892 RepID=UPI00209EE13F|nr:hypothetical protein [Acinetobacter indicus]MCP0920797.1 hypothetical protein [Acinetobacter indicus]